MMPYLDAALAFTLTMLALATLVTRIVDLVKNTAKMRQQGLRDMLTDYFKSEFVPVVHRELGRLKTTTVVGATDGLHDALTKFNPSIVFDKVEAESLVDISTTELLELLKRSEFGHKMLTDLGDKANEVFDELGKRYEAVGAKATESFRKNSKIWAFVIALVIAFVLNVDSIYMAKSYVSNASVSQAIIAQKDAFVSDYDALAKQLGNGQDEANFTRADLEQAFHNSRTQLNTVTNAGFPLGWSYFPYSWPTSGGNLPDSRDRNNVLDWVSWLAGILITAVLAGLGGPFWYDAVASLSRIVQGTRAAAKKTEQPSGVSAQNLA